MSMGAASAQMGRRDVIRCSGWFASLDGYDKGICSRNVLLWTGGTKSK